MGDMPVSLCSFVLIFFILFILQRGEHFLFFILFPQGDEQDGGHAEVGSEDHHVCYGSLAHDRKP
jgi:hypothetical protein